MFDNSPATSVLTALVRERAEPPPWSDEQAREALDTVVEELLDVEQQHAPADARGLERDTEAPERL